MVACFLCGELEHHGGRIAMFDGVQIASDIAPLNTGHMLIASIEHNLSLAHLTLHELDNIGRLTASLRTLVSAKYHQNVVLFEHGMGDACEMPACGIDHCHLHLLPVPVTGRFFSQGLVSYLKGFGLAVESLVMDCYRQLKLMEGKNYLFTEDINGEKRVITVADYFPSQVLRRYAAARLGSPYTYDWQLFKNEDEAQKTTQDLRELLTNTSSSAVMMKQRTRL